jgi:purine-binding chemotaxis protein CheW
MWLVMRVGSRKCALPVTCAIETMRPLPIEEVGRRRPGVLGLARVRGISVPVVDVAGLFGLAPAAPGAGARFVTIRVGAPERVVALAVDEVVGVRDVPTAAWHALPGLVGAADDTIVQAMARADAELVLALDTARLLPPEDNEPTEAADR